MRETRGACEVAAGTTTFWARAADEKNAFVCFALLKARFEMRATAPRVVSMAVVKERLAGNSRNPSTRRNYCSHAPGFIRLNPFPLSAVSNPESDSMELANKIDALQAGNTAVHTGVTHRSSPGSCSRRKGNRASQSATRNIWPNIFSLRGRRL